MAQRGEIPSTATPLNKPKDWKAPTTNAKFPSASGASASKEVKKPFERSTQPVGGNSRTQLSNPISSSTQCFKCKGYGHLSKDCPTRKTMVLVGDLVYEQDSEPEEEEGVEGDEDEGDEGEITMIEDDDSHAFLVVRRSLGALCVEYVETLQRENLFHSKCRVMGLLCSMIIDSGSCANVISQTLVTQLKIPTLKHPSPYKLQWLSECGELRVVKQCLIKFKIGNYVDEHMFDVVPMQACHLLFGRPWQFDFDVWFIMVMPTPIR